MPEGVSFQTKPQLAQLMLERTVESGVPFGWVTGDEVYGSDRPREGGAVMLMFIVNQVRHTHPLTRG